MRYAPLAIVVAATLLMVPSAAPAADHAITGTKLVLKPGKVVLVAKDAAISGAGVDPIHGTDSSVSFDDGSGPVTFAMPASLWTANKPGTVFKFKNASAPNAPSAVKVSKVKNGMFKVVAKALPFPVPSGMATISVAFSFAGVQTYRLTFVQPPGGIKFFEVSPTPTPVPTLTGTATSTASGIQTATHTGTATSTASRTETVTLTPTATLIPTATLTPTATPTETPTLGPCTGQIVGGACWFLGAPDQSCDQACAAVGRSCSLATRDYAGFPYGTLQHCATVLAAFGLPIPQDVGEFASPGIGCFSLVPATTFRDVFAPTTCGASVTGFSRACACV